MLPSNACWAPLSSADYEETEVYTLTDEDRALFEEICFLYRHATEQLQAGRLDSLESMQRRRLELLAEVKRRDFPAHELDIELATWSEAVRRAEAAFVEALKQRHRQVHAELRSRGVQVISAHIEPDADDLAHEPLDGPHDGPHDDRSEEGLAQDDLTAYDRARRTACPGVGDDAVARLVGARGRRTKPERPRDLAST